MNGAAEGAPAHGRYRVSIVIGGRFHAFDLARELERRGLLHRIVTNYPKYKTRAFGVSDPHVASFPTVLVQRAIQRLVPRWAAASWYPLNLAFGALAASALDGSDLVHGWSGYSLPSLRWAKRHGCPTVLERSSSHIQTQLELLREEHQRVGVPWHQNATGLQRDLEEYESADLIAVPSLFAKRSFLARGFDESRILHAPFGASLETFSPGPKGDDVFRVLYAGQLSLRKGIHDLVQAFKLARVARSELCLVGSAATETPTLLRGAPDNMRLVGHVPQAELVHHYRTGSVFAMASVEEGLATVQAQAMACGLPLICTAHTGGEDLLRMTGALVASHPDGIDEYPAGYVVPIRAPEAMARCFAWLAADPELLRSKRQSALAIREGKLGWAAYAERVTAGYERLMGGAARTRSQPAYA